MSETSGITAPLMKMIQQMGHMVLRMNSGTMKKGKHWVKLHEAGTADLLVFRRGKPVLWLETKKPKNEGGHTNREQIDAQAMFCTRVVGFGHTYAQVTSIDEAIKVVKYDHL